MFFLTKTEYLKPNTVYISALLLITALTFSPCLKNGFVSWDDPQYLMKNSAVTGESWTKAVSSYQGYYHPLPLITYRLEYSLFGFKPFPFHLTNCLLHIADTLLVFWLLALLGCGETGAFAGALLFGIHPLHVEPAAWLSGRKDLLYGFFFLLSSALYLQSGKNGKRKFPAWSLAAFLFALLSKPFAVTTPLVFFIYDYAGGRKFDKRLLLEKIPYIAAAALFLAVSYLPQAVLGAQGGFLLAERAETASTAADKIAVSGRALYFYVEKFFYPSRLAGLYPLLPYRGNFPWRFGLTALFAAFTAVLVLLDRREKKYSSAWLMFLVLVSPALPFPQIYPADRYMYVPLAGLAFLAAGFYSPFIARFRRAALFSGCVIGAALCAASFLRCAAWRDSFSLWNDVLAKYPVSDGAYKAYVNRGEIYLERKEPGPAVSDFNHSLKMHPGYIPALMGLGDVCFDLGEYLKAAGYYGEVLKNDPGSSRAYYNRARVFAEQGKFKEAFADFGQALRLSPDNYFIYDARGNLFRKLKQYDNASADFTRAVKFNPRYPEAWNDRGSVYRETGDIPGAVKDFDSALELNPDFPEALVNRGSMHSLYREYDEALGLFSRALELNPGFAEAYNNRGGVYGEKGELEKALADFNSAARISPAYAEAYFNRACAYLDMGKFGLAIRDYGKALKINPAFGGAYFFRAQAYEKSGNFRAALLDAEKAVKTGYKVPPAYLASLRLKAR